MKKMTIWPFLVIALGSVLAFRDTLMSGFDHVGGDWEDGMLIIGITEHWYQLLLGRFSWNTLPMFYPVTGNLGYSDTLFIYGLIHSLWRSVGFDVFLAFSTTLLTVCALGLWGMWRLLGLMPAVPLVVRIWGVLLFALVSPINSSISNSHLQFAAAWLSPWFFWLIWKVLNSDLKEQMRFSGCLGGCLAILAFSTFYTAWYLIFYLCLCLSWFVILRYISVLKTVFPNEGILFGVNLKCWSFVEDLKRFTQLKRISLLSFGGIFVLLVLPFCWVYLPVLKNIGGSSFGSLMSLVDYVNAGQHNVLWGWMHEWLGLEKRHLYWELRLGFPPVTFLSLISAAVWVFLKGKIAQGQFPRQTEEGLWWRVLPLLLLALFTSWLLMLKIGGSGLWVLVNEFVPGASVIRVVARFNTLLSLPVVLTLVFVIGYWWRKGSDQMSARWHHGKVYGLSFLMVILLAEQIRHGYDKPMLLRSQALEALNSIPEAPTGTQVFALSSGSLIDIPGTQAGSVRDQMLALHLAQQRGMQTVNGYSGRFPPSWHLIDPRDSSYEVNLRGWMLRHEIEHLSLLDLAAKTWRHHKALEVLSWVPPSVETPSEDRRDQWPPEIFLYGFSSVETWGVWSTGREAALRFDIPAEHVPENTIYLKLTLGAFVNSSLRKQQIVIEESGGFEKVIEIVAENPNQTVLIPLASNRAGEGIGVDVTFHNRDLAKPWKHGLPHETRRLGVSIVGIELVTEP